MMSFVDEGTRAKFSMVKNADDLAAICGIGVGDLPPPLRRLARRAR